MTIAAEALRGRRQALVGQAGGRIGGGDITPLEERLFTVEEAYEAAEAFLTSASNFVLPVVSIDGRPVADGRPGQITKRLRELYLAMATAPALAAE